MDGIILVNKEEGYTSRDVVNKIGKIFNTRKVGHTGTLDPLASGVLVICMGKALKICEFITAYSKEYVAEVLLGINTDTLDITGNVLEKKEVNKISKEEVSEVLKSFLGESIQEVPIYSAVKVNGKKLYEYARSGEEVELPKKKIFVSEIELLGDINYEEEGVSFKFRCIVSKGTYIRSLIRDISLKLGTVGIMKNLIRTKQGSFDIKDCCKVKDIQNGNYKVLSIEEVLSDIPSVEVDGDILFKIKNGAKVDNFVNSDMVLFKCKNEVVALYKRCEDNKDMLRSFKQF